MNQEIIKNKKLIDKYLKKEKHICVFDILINDVNNLSFYIRLDYSKKNSLYKVIWVNLTQMSTNKASEWINSSLIYPTQVEKFKEIIATHGITQDYIDEDDIECNVIMNSYITNYVNNKKTFEFKRYIPLCWSFLADAIYIIFDALPRFMFLEFQVLTQKLVNPKINTIFVFDLEKDNIDDLFEDKIIEMGKEYYKNNRVTYIEHLKDTTYAIVCGTQNYLTVVHYSKSTKEMQMSCTCDCNHFCKHMYATLLAMKDKLEYKFFKISYIDNSKSLLDNISNFSFFLCAGIYKDSFVIINNDNFEFIPILNDNMLNFKIVEDDKNHTLEKELKEYLDKNQK